MSDLYFGGDDLVIGEDPMAELFSGDYDIMGEDDFADEYGEEFSGDYDIMGATSGGRRARMRARAKRLALARAAGGKLVSSKEPSREYRQVLPATRENIASLAIETISLNPQRPFRPEAFRASSTHTSPYFVITAYSIGQDNQFVGPGSIPVDLFSEVAFDSKVIGYTANLGSLITLVVQNIDSQARDFRAAFFGTALGN